jgi:hypothetical protein
MVLRSVLFALVLCTGAAHAAQPVDPPSRVARLAYVEGDVSFSPAGDDRWYRAQLNRPQVAGDRLWIGRGGRAELQLGGAAIRLDQGTGIEILALDDRDVLVELTQGTLNLHVRRAWEGQSYEIATPTLAMVVRERGDFRVDVDDRGAWTEVIAWRGFADIYGERARFSLREGEAVRFDDPRLRGYRQFDPPPPDAFDRFVDARNRREERALARRYVPEDMIGYADLDDYGRWSNDPEYGALWYPRVAAGWAPYRDGRWIWQDPWGWTWVDDAPYGFATSHYGRWLRVGGRWAWLPTPVRSRAVYAPALVAFVGYGGGSIGWFPLGPRDVYVPGYRASRGYFDRVNPYRWIDSRVAGDVWTGYSTGRLRFDRQRYTHRDRDAQTVVARDAFVSGRTAGRSRQQPTAGMDASAQLSALANMAPVERSLAGGAAAAASAPDDALFERRVRARRAPPAADVPFAQRAQRWQRNPGQPIATDELARMQRAAPATDVQAVGEAGPDLRGQAGGGARSDEGSRRDQPAGDGRGRGRERDTGASAEAQRQADAERARADQEAALAAQRDAERQQQRDADRERKRTEMEAQREAERQQREAQQAQADAARRQQEANEQAERESRARYEQEQRDRELERQRQQTEREQQELQREQAEAERAQQEAAREAQRQQQEAERQAQRDAERAQQEAQRDAERAQQEAQREAEREAQRAQQEAEREAQRAQQEAEREAQREAERAQREAEKDQRESEREERKRDRDEGEEQPQRA